MKKSLVALALFGAFAGVAHAQSSVVIYGLLDAGIQKKSGSIFDLPGAKLTPAVLSVVGNPTTIGAADNNRIGFKGTEDLGNGLNALFQLEMRFSPDTGAVEGPAATPRPLFQGQSRVGLQSNSFGTVRIGRGLTAFQESITAFEPWNGAGNAGAGFLLDLQVAGYTSDPLSPAGNSANRFANAVFYNSPNVSGFQVNATVATKEGNGGAVTGVGAGAASYTATSSASANPYSLSATYNNGPIGALAAYERNAVETKFWSIAGSYYPITPLKLVASYQHQDQSHTVSTNSATKSWILGANYNVTPAGKILAGYGQKTIDGPTAKTKQASLGYQYSLSKRTYVYGDVSNKKQALAAGSATSVTVNYYGVGVHHTF
jgi:predicted porin